MNYRLLNKVIDILQGMRDEKSYLDLYQQKDKLLEELKLFRYKKLDAKEQVEGEDMLRNLFGLQKIIIIKLKEKFPKIKLNYNDIIDHMFSELMELKDSFPWKKWKENYNHVSLKHIEHAKEEVVDLLHLLIEFSILFLKMDADELYSQYLEKHKKNIERYDGGY